ncbi:MAG: carotenoid biosynthesis protein [Kiritimatiellia bacterium]
MNPTLPGAWRLYARAAALVLAVLYAVGTVGHALPETLPFMLLLTPGFLLATGLLAVAPSVAAGDGRFALWMAGAYVVTFAAEAAGVATGAVFGEYVYGPTLGWQALDVPLIIAFNWVMVVNGAVCIAGRIVPPRAGVGPKAAMPLLAGLIAAAFDFLMEPVAIRLDYWTWAGGTIPLQNYAAWFVLAAVLAAVHPRRLRTACDLGTHGLLAGIYVGMQAIFFLALRIVWRLQET